MRRRTGIAAWIVIAGLAVSGRGQDPIPSLLPVLPAPTVIPNPGSGDPPIEPVQFLQAGVPQVNPAGLNQSVPNAVAPPVVALEVRVPQSIASNATAVPCQIVVRNTSNAEAYSVTVRVPARRLGGTVAGAAPPPVSTPVPNSDANYRWRFPTLRGGESKTIKFDLQLNKETAASGELGLKAYVSFEHGVEVVTKFGTPKLILRKEAPKDAATSDAIPIRMTVQNSGDVPLRDVKVTETITDGYDFAEGTTGETTKDPRQRVWKLGTLRPGESRLVSYQLLAKKAGEIRTLTVVDSTDGQQETKDAVIRVLNASLVVRMNGPREAGAGESAVYTVSVKNTGDLPQRNIRVTGSIPADCTLTKMTFRGRPTRDRVEWVIPELKAGETWDVRFGIKAETGGKRLVSASAQDARGKEVSDTRETMFAATADLSWETYPDPVSLTVGKTGAFVVKVRNVGAESARNVSLKVELPADFRRTTIRPRDAKEAGQEILFKAETIPAGGTREFVVEFKAEKIGRATIVARLDADALGDKPLTAEKMVTVTPNRDSK